MLNIVILKLIGLIFSKVYVNHELEFVKKKITPKIS